MGESFFDIDNFKNLFESREKGESERAKLALQPFIGMDQSQIEAAGFTRTSLIRNLHDEVDFTEEREGTVVVVYTGAEVGRTIPLTAIYLGGFEDKTKDRHRLYHLVGPDSLARLNMRTRGVEYALSKIQGPDTGFPMRLTVGTNLPSPIKGQEVNIDRIGIYTQGIREKEREVRKKPIAELTPVPVKVRSK